MNEIYVDVSCSQSVMGISRLNGVLFIHVLAPFPHFLF